MDPFSITVGVFGILTAAKAISKCASEFYTIARETRAIRKDVQNFASSIHNFGSIVESVYYTLDLHCKDSLVVKRLNKTLGELAGESEYLIIRLNGLKPKLRNSPEPPGLYIRYRWHKNSRKREENWIWMERIKSCFVMIMIQVIIENLEKRQAIDDSPALRNQL